VQLPAAISSSFVSIPPMYTWPKAVKRLMLFGAVLIVIVAYALLGGGLIALLAVMAGQAG
jgi:hypothetical protein